MMRLIVLLAALAVAAPAVAQVRPIEPLYAIRVGQGAVTVTVASNGCTAKADFTIGVLKQAPASTVLFARKHPDLCRAAPGHVELVYSFSDLGLAPGDAFVLANPLAADPAP
jgi:hypothetical protein